MAEKLNTGCADSNEQTPMVYNVINGHQGASIIDWVVSAWPATSSNW